MRRSAAILVASALALAGAGCETFSPALTCDRSAAGNPALDYSGGLVDGGVYRSSPWDGELLSFPGGMRYRIEHHLGAVPRWIRIYESLSRYGADAGTLVLAVGDAAVIVGVDEQAITIANDDCAGFWVLVEAGVD